jgi:hypothetical protein
MLATKLAQNVSTQAHYTEITMPGSAGHQEIRSFQQEIFSHVVRAQPQSYLQTVDFAPEQSIPIAVRRQQSNLLVGVIRLELPPNSVIESVVRFVQDSPSVHSLRAGRIAEMGGFAVRPGLQRDELLDVLDVMAATIIQVTEQKIDWLWLLPRRQLMRLLRADIPHLLPPYHFSLCHDILGWNESSDRLRELRELQVKGFFIRPQDTPCVYTISRRTLAHDLAQRIALHKERHQHSELLQLLNPAMRQAQEDMLREQNMYNERRNTDGHQA